MLLFLAAAAAAAAPAEESFSFSLEPLWHDKGVPLAIMGMTVVFIALLAISTFISQLPRVMSWIDGVAPQTKPAPVAKLAAKKEEDAELIAVIAAAVEVALGPGHRVIHTQQLTPRELAWSQQGRWQHQTSHKPR